MRYDAVIFDLFGTLVDNLEGDPYEAMVGRMAGALGLDEAHFMRAWSDPVVYETRATGALPSLRDNILHACRRAGAQPRWTHCGGPLKTAGGIG